MLHEVIVDYISRNRNTILSFISQLESYEEELPEIDWRFLPSSTWPGPIVGVDGSVNSIEYKGCLFMVADAEAVASNNGLSRVAAGGFADFLLPYWLPRERSRVYMSILELYVALQALEKLRNALVLMDGSLLNIFPKSLRRYYSSSLAREYEHQVSLSPCREYCDSSVRELVKGLANEPLPSEEIRRRAATLELIELLKVLYVILKRHGGRIAWIAKNSTDTTLFKKSLSDIAVLERTTKGRGYTPAGTSLLEPPPGAEASSFLGGVPVNVYYVRLNEEGPVLRLEAPFMGEDTAKHVMGSLTRVSAAGYPYVLRRAHRDVIVRKKDIETLARLLGLKLVTPARWYL